MMHYTESTQEKSPTALFYMCLERSRNTVLNRGYDFIIFRRSIKKSVVHFLKSLVEAIKRISI